MSAKAKSLGCMQFADLKLLECDMRDSTVTLLIEGSKKRVKVKMNLWRAVHVLTDIAKQATGKQGDYVREQQRYFELLKAVSGYIEPTKSSAFT